MKKRLGCLALFAVAAAIAVFVMNGHGPREPEHEGRRLSQWLKQAFAVGPFDDPDTNCLKTIRSIGSNAVPWLISELDARDGALKRWLNRRAESSSWLRMPWTSAELRRQYAAQGFVVLGPLARSAIPQLFDRLGNEEMPAVAEWALAGIARRETGAEEHDAWYGVDSRHPNAELQAIRREIVGRTMAATRSGDPKRRASAFRVLGRIAEDSPDAIPTLLRGLKDSDPLPRACCAYALGELAEQPETVVPALVDAAALGTAETQEVALYALGRFEEEARSAVSLVCKLATNGTSRVQSVARQVLGKIDPAKAAQLGYK